MLAAIGGALAAVPSPSQVGTQSEAARYVATHTMLLNDPSLVDTGAASISANQVPLFATTGEVPERVRELVGFEGNSAQLADQLRVVFGPETTALTFTTNQATPELAVLIADTFADETASFLAERQDKLYEERLAASNLRLTELEDRVAYLRNRLDPVLAPEYPEPIAKGQGGGLTPAPPPRSTITQRFELTGDRIAALLNQVNGIINRVEV